MNSARSAHSFGPRLALVPLLFLAPLLMGACHAASKNPGYQGVVEYEERTLAFEVPGRIAQSKLERGSMVDPGALLATVDDRVARGDRNIREAELGARRAELALVRAGSRREDVRAASAELDSARTDEDIARRTLERDRGLVQSGALPAAQLDDPERKLAQAESHRRASEEKSRELRAGSRSEEVDAAEARVQGAEAALSADDLRLARYVLLSPIRGRVLDVLHREGEMVSAGTPVVRLADTEHPYVDLFVPQGDVTGVHVGSAAHLRADGVGEVLQGKVEDVGRELEFTPHFVFSERERPNLMVRVRVRIDDARALLHAGAPVFADIDRGGS